jgi:ribosomal protein S18 acetylase RimI-like enzyme
VTTFDSPDPDALPADVESLWEAFVDQQSNVVDMPDAERAHLSTVWKTRFAAERERGPFRIEVARVDDDAVGFCTASVKGNEGAIGYLFVAATHRSTGLGATLLGRAQGWMQQHGAEIVTLVVRAGNDAASGWYARQGYAPTYAVMHRVLPSR